MNTCVQAGVLTLGVVAEIIQPKTSVVVIVADNTLSTHITEVLCLPQPKLIVNGHSISAINPESFSLGGLTTLLMA